MERKTIWVKATPHPEPTLAGKARVPKEHASRRYVFESPTVEVPDTPYYRKLIRQGLLELCSGPAPVDPRRPRPMIDLAGHDHPMEDDQ